MKSDIHPEYRPTVFRDRSVDFMFLTRSTAKTRDTVEWEDGNTYPVVDVEVSAASHPFYTGKAHTIDAAGRIEKFNRKYGKR
jgi:large subunit ribosomal protein L31